MMDYRVFSHPEELCNFINRTGYKVIQIVFAPGVFSSYPYILFFGDKEDSNA